MSMNEPCHRCGGSGNDPEHDGPCSECWAVNSKAREYDVVGDGLYAKLCRLFDKRAEQLHHVPGAYTHQLALVAAEFTRQQIITLQNAIRKHRDQRGDDRCWMDDEELYAVLPEGYTPPERDGAVELKNCERFIASRQNPKTEYVSPERMAWDEAERIITELEFGDPVTKGIAIARFRKAKGDPDPVIAAIEL